MGKSIAAPVRAGWDRASSSTASSGPPVPLGGGDGWGNLAAWTSLKDASILPITSRSSKQARKMMSLMGSTGPFFWQVGCRYPIWSSHAFDRDRLHYQVLARSVLCAARDVGDLVNHVLALHYFAEDGVLAGKPISGGHSNEKLRSVGVGPGIGHGQLALLVEPVRQTFGFVLKLVASAAQAVTPGSAPPHHELRNNPLK